LRQLLANADGEIQRQQGSIADLERCRAEAALNYAEFQRRQAEIGRVGDDLALYHRYADQISRLLEAENSERGILFEKVIPASGSRIPVSPRAITIVVLALAAGLAVGVVILLFAELLDQTIRTRRQIAQTLGINILESVDVIVTSAVRRRRAVRKVLVPVVTTVLVLAVVMSGSLVYLSLQQRSTFERVVRWPRTAVRGVMTHWGGNDKIVAHAGGDGGSTPPPMVGGAHPTRWATRPKMGKSARAAELDRTGSVKRGSPGFWDRFLAEHGGWAVHGEQGRSG